MFGRECVIRWMCGVRDFALISSNINLQMVRMDEGVVESIYSQKLWDCGC